MRISDWSSDVCSSDLDPFIDGRITVGHRLQAVAGEKDLMVGIALSGGAQPSLSRLDIGPQISARLPIGKGHARLALEWRQRIAGRARPPSGLAVRSEEHTSELQSLMRISYAVFCLKKKNANNTTT